MSFSKPIQTETQAALQNGGLPALEDVYDFSRWNPYVDNPPRPANAFILFRAWLVLTRKEQFSNLKTQELSAKLSLEWSSATEEVRDHFGQLHALLKRKHNETYPDYKYRPKHNSVKAESRRSGLKRNLKSPSSPLEQSCISKPNCDGLEMSLTSLHTFGRDSTGGLVLNTSLPGEFFASRNAPVVHGPFWIACPPGSTPESVHTGSILLTNSTQALGNDPALAPDSSEILALICRNVHSATVEAQPKGKEELPDSTLSEPSEATNDSMDVDLTLEGLHSASGFSTFNLDPRSNEQVVQNDSDCYSVAGVALANSVEWDPYPMLGYEAKAYLHRNPLEGPSTYHWQPVDMDTYSVEDEQALDDFMAKFMNFDD